MHTISLPRTASSNSANLAASHPTQNRQLCVGSVRRTTSAIFERLRRLLPTPLPRPRMMLSKFSHCPTDSSHFCISDIVLDISPSHRGNVKMATEGMVAENSAESKSTPEEDRELQTKLRDFGQEYISRSGRLVPAKLQPDVLCSCPQRCNERISSENRMKLFEEFYKLGDQNKQNEFLRAHIKARAVQKRSPDNKPLKRAKRRVSCKYRVPQVSKSGPIPAGATLIEVCQKAFMNIFVITEKRVRLQREKLIVEVMGTKAVPHVHYKRHPYDIPNTCKVPLEPADEPIDMTIPRNTTEIDVTILKGREQDIALVDNFFMNQLWKPEYINKAI